MLNGRGKTRSMRVILTNTLMKCLPIFKDTNYETKKKSLVSRGLGACNPPNDCNLPFT